MSDSGDAGPVGFGPAQVPTSPDLVVDSIVSRPLQDLMAQTPDDEPMAVVIEVNAHYPDGARAAAEVLTEELRQLPPLDDAAPSGPARPGTDTPEKGRRVDGSSGYVTTHLTPDEVRALVETDIRSSQDAAADRPATNDSAHRAPRLLVHRIWPDFTVRALITRSIVTTKCDAARRAFDARGQGIVWAVLDSGIDPTHRHFAQYGNVDPSDPLHRSFVGDAPGDALVDESGHGTHVAGIIAGAQEGDGGVAAAGFFRDETEKRRTQRLCISSLSGMAPQTSLISLKVLRRDGSGDVSAMLAALRYVQEQNDHGRTLRIHGLNISVGYPFDPAWFATGLTPVCREVDRLVKSGVVVVVAAGNTGYGVGVDTQGRTSRVGFAMTIQDPGNAELAITVGATSASPHSTGVSFFSSKGPTGDGRMKPDLVAPGERVISAATGALLVEAQRDVTGEVTYVEDSGTSMAAPHVSGAVAAFLSVHPEYIGRPEDVKRIFMASATDLGRAPAFQGAGLVDAMRAIQSV